jgi:hypothetical protein
MYSLDIMIVGLTEFSSNFIFAIKKYIYIFHM